MFDNYPEIAQNYGEAIMDRYEIEVENKKLKSKQLYKEDFEKIEYHERDYEDGFLLKGVDLRPDSPELVETIIKLKDNSKLEKLYSKEDK